MSPPRTTTSSALAAVVLTSAVLTGCASTGASPAPTSSASSSDELGNGFTAEILVDLCIDKSVESYELDVEYDDTAARVEERAVEDTWLVIVPSRSVGQDAVSLCVIGGTPGAPVFDAYGATQPLSEDEIRAWIAGMPGPTE